MSKTMKKGDKVQTESGAIGTVVRWNRDYTIAVEFAGGSVFHYCVAQLKFV